MKSTNLSVNENVIFGETTKFHGDEYKWFYSITWDEFSLTHQEIIQSIHDNQ